MSTLIQVDNKNWKRMSRMKSGPGDTFNDVINRLFDIAQKVKTADKLEEKEDEERM
ncbi:MAG: hypothetical protein ACTSXD_11645 [Candidatus Heimdallarchaeaceae archaeon]